MENKKKSKFKEAMGPPKSLKKYSYGYSDNLPRYGYLGRNNPKGLESRRPDPYEGMEFEPPHRGGGQASAKRKTGKAKDINLPKDLKAFKKENRKMQQGKSLTDVLLEKEKKKRKAKRKINKNLIPSEPRNMPGFVPQG